MSERVLDARLHGHGGGVEYEAFRALVGGILDREIPAHDWHTCICPDCARVLAVAEFVRYYADRFASNPEPGEAKNQEAWRLVDKLRQEQFVDRMTINELRKKIVEPHDAEVREAVEYFDNFRHPYNIADSEFWQTIKAALRSQVGQGRVVTAEIIKELVYKKGTPRGAQDIADRLNALLSPPPAQEMVEGVDGVPWCAPCRSYHVKPRNRAHWEALKCFAPWEEDSALKEAKS